LTKKTFFTLRFNIVEGGESFVLLYKLFQKLENDSDVDEIDIFYEVLLLKNDRPKMVILHRIFNKFVDTLFLSKTVYELEVAFLMNHAPTRDRIELFRFATPCLKRVKRDRLICRILMK